jgi:hypothetical protein
MKRQFAAALVALMLVTAGCSFGGTGPGDSGEPSDGTSGDAVGTINFYISDQPGAIEDFEHLNVTVSQVEFRRAGSEDDDEDGSTPTDNTATTSAGATDEEMDDSGVQRFDIDDRTVDLTRLKGDNATLLEEFEVENGTYTQVRISVSDINGTLTDGSSADVKLPSEKLRINQQFVVGNNESVDFVYDITVIKRGQSGSYNIQPVASESGTDVPIDRVDDDEDADEERGQDERDDPDRGDEMADNETAEFVGNVTAGENATVYVSQNGTAVENATVTYEGDEYLTNAGGNVTLAVPSDAEEVEVEYEDGTVTLKEEVESSDEETVTATEEGNTETETTTATPTPTSTGTSTDTANG